MGTTDDLPALDLPDADDEGPSEDRPARAWQLPVLVACAVVAAVALVVIAVMSWRQADYARQQSCLSKAYALTEFERDVDGEDQGATQRSRVAACFGVDPPEARVPNVVGMQVAVASSRLRNADLVPVLEAGDPTGPDAFVRAQEPPAGASVPEGSTVGLRSRR